jgi:thioester reductase-like protein
VGGVLEALRLAAHGKAKPLHYFSSLSVISGLEEGQVVRETDEPGDPGQILGGYAESRWVGEKLMWMAQARGFPVAIYRPGLVIGEGGAATAGDLVWRLVKHCIDTGIGPKVDFNLYLTPVEYVAAAMVRLALRPDAAGRCFHLINAHPLNLGDILASAAAYGYRIRQVPTAEWEAKSARAENRDAWNSLLPYLLLLPERNKETVRGFSRMPVFDCANVTAGLAGSDIECPPVETAMLQRCFEHFVRAGVWPPPQQEQQPAEM